MWEKQNLVTEAKGDQLKCSHCGYTFWHRQLQRPSKCVKCGCLDIEEHPTKGYIIYGCWAKTPLGQFCPKCKGSMILVVKEHANSRFLVFKRDDGLSLIACVNDCPE